ncbi:hypothetical protein [Pedobacter alluvionis]|uniref:Uncharacterized protein n=1 Tax=Pedobacter alluvionis TaxID=475253 RepID=A0A497Y7R5_9SPHI|nr:hypothetical protein [Pedobacter alluvionis]RLJ77008.1 hypothetical protein BCL90_2068 [Pedobacter alluvionis]
MNHSITKEDRIYLFVLFLVLLTYLSFELFRFGFEHGKDYAVAALSL